LRPELGIALGQNGVKPLELAEMYATFAARGVRHDPFLVDKVTAADGRILFRQQVASEKVLDQNVADTVNHVLQGVIQHGTGQSAAIGRPAAGKTGTTEELVDAWFAGYTPDLAAVVWNGYPNNESTPLLNVHGLPKVFGGTFPARMWKLFMQRALQGFPPTPFATPTIAGSPSPSPSGSPSPSPTAPVSPSPTVSVLPSPGPSKSPKPSKSPTSSPSPSPTGAST
jgi:membrane peptidoglycan carboxypeptidase